VKNVRKNCPPLALADSRIKNARSGGASGDHAGNTEAKHKALLQQKIQLPGIKGVVGYSA